MAQLPTIEDVAREADVSRQTVSNVLNSPEIVKEETRARVEAVIARLGYRPHASARRLRTRQSSTIGIRMDPLSNGISGSVLDRYLHALTAQAAKRGMRIMLFTATDGADEIEQYRVLRDGADVDAFVITDTAYQDARIGWLVSEGVPFVSFGRPWSEEDADSPRHLWVDVDGYAGVFDATTHLIGRGIERIGFLGWPSGSGTGDERRRGWVTAMSQTFGLTPDQLESMTVRMQDRVPEARRAVETLMREDRFDALVCVSDSIALGAMMAVNEAGRRAFPVIGFDNTPVAQAVGLSSVEQQLDLVAEATLELLMGATGRRVLPVRDGEHDVRHRLVTPKLVVRRSSHLAPVEEAGAIAGNHNREE